MSTKLKSTNFLLSVKSGVLITVGKHSKHHMLEITAIVVRIIVLTFCY